MSKAEDLAAELEAASHEFADYVAGLTPEEWRSIAVNTPGVTWGEDERRPVGVVAHHVGDMLPMLVERAFLLATAGSVSPMTTADVNGINAKHAAANASPDQAETVALIRDNGSRAAELLRELDDEGLEREGTTGAGPFTAERLVRRIVIGHISQHAGSIRATVAR
jgi:hypothetical protein